MPGIADNQFKTPEKPKVIAQFIGGECRPVSEEKRAKYERGNAPEMEWVWRIKPLSYVLNDGREAIEYTMPLVFNANGKLFKSQKSAETAMGGKTFTTTEELEAALNGKFIEYQYTPMYPPRNIDQQVPEYMKILRLVTAEEAQAAADASAPVAADGSGGAWSGGNGAAGTATTVAPSRSVADIVTALIGDGALTSRQVREAFLKSDFKSNAQASAAIVGSSDKTLARLVDEGILSQEGDAYRVVS